MRIVILGAGGARKTESSILRAAVSLGHQTRLVDLVGWLRYAGPWAAKLVRHSTQSFEPDLLILTRHAIELGDSNLKALINRRPAAFWYFDLYPKEAALRLGRLVGTMYVTYLGQVDAYRKAGIERVEFLPQGVDPELDAPASSAPARYHCDASFVGSGQPTYRHEVLRAIASVCRLQIRGPGWDSAPRDLPVAGGPVYGKRLAQVIRGAAISLGASSHPQQDIERGSASNRMWKILGCQGFYLGRYVEGIDHFATGGRHCVWYRTSKEAAELTRYYLGRPEQRSEIAREGRAHALAHHTYAHRLELLLAGKGYPLQTIL